MSGNGRDDVDWSKLGLSQELIAEALAHEPMAKKPDTFKRSTRPYTKFPDAWRDQLADVDAPGSTYQVALYLLRRHWHTGKDRIELPNKALRLRGISRQSKWRALAQLHAAGLILVENRDGKSPLIHILHAK